MKQIVLCHGNNSAHHIIHRDGIVSTVLGSKKEFTLDLKPIDFEKYGVEYRNLEEHIIAISLDSCGPVCLKNGYFYSLTDLMPVDDAYEYCIKTKWRSYQHWELYYEEQLESLRKLLISLCKKHAIPNKYNADIWDLSRRALMGTPGIFCQCSFIKNAHDLNPQIELINILKSL